MLGHRLRFQKKLSLWVLLLISSLMCLAAHDNQRLWSHDTEIFSRIQQLYRLEGLTPPIPTGPWTTAQLQFYIDAFSNQVGATANSTLLESITSDLQRESRSTIGEEGAIDYAFNYAFESYIHANDTDFIAEADWQQGWLQRAPILQIPLTISALDTFSMQIDFSVMQRMFLDLSSPNDNYRAQFWTNNTITDFFDLDLRWPYKAVGVIGADQWNLSFGRDRITSGPGRTGNLVVSAEVPFHEHLRFTTYFGNFSFESTFIGFPSPVETGQNSTDHIKLFTSHRFEFQLFKRLRIAMLEAMMYQAPVLDLRYMNPFMIYHQYFMSDKSNSIASIEAQMSVFPGLSLYGQFAFDNFQILGESESIPDAFGWQVGAEYGFLNRFGSLLLWVEHVQITPMMYQRNGIDFIVAYNANGTYVWNFLGYPDGGDAIVSAAGFEWDSLENYAFSVSIKHRTQGATPLWASYPPAEPQAKTPTGIAEKALILGIQASYDFQEKSFLGIYSGPKFYAKGDFVWIENKDNRTADAVFDTQWTLGVTLGF